MHRVVDKSTRRGRPPSFDHDAVVDAAMRAFWDRGFEGTSLSDLEAATGADRSTLYNSFGGKAGLYREAAGRYVDLVEEHLFAPLTVGERGLEDIVDFFDRLGEQFDPGAHPPGCLIVNDLTALDHDQAASDRYLDRLSDGLQTALQRAAASGEIDPSHVDELAEVLTAAVIGINTIARRHPGDPGPPARSAAAARSLVSRS